MDYSNTTDKVNNWFDSNLDKIKEGANTELDLRVFSALIYARKYFNATMKLLESEHILPTKALLRVMLELYIKLAWCMTQGSNDKIYLRFRRWDYSRLKEQRKQLQKVDAEKYPEKDNAITKITTMINNLKGEGLKMMPDFSGLIRDLPPDWDTYIYAELYLDFNQAIHSDFRILHELVSHDKDKNEITYRHDIDYDPNKLLRYCISMCNDINIIIKEHYAWNIEKQQKEYEQICSL